jgi:hypothetical protein
MAGLIRPHMAGIWIAGTMPALLVALFVGRALRDRRRTGRDRLVLLSVIAVATAALWFVASAAVRYLNPKDENGTVSATSIIDVLKEATRRTTGSGSNFQPPTIHGPLDWPYAALRTLVRPLPTEAFGAAQLFSALEITLFIGLCLLSFRRLVNLPRLASTVPFVAFAVTTLFLGGLIFASFANLGVLTRQKSLLFPFLLLIPCLPPLPRAIGSQPTEPGHIARPLSSTLSG